LKIFNGTFDKDNNSIKQKYKNDIILNVMKSFYQFVLYPDYDNLEIDYQSKNDLIEILTNIYESNLT